MAKGTHVNALMIVPTHIAPSRDRGRLNFVSKVSELEVASDSVQMQLNA